MNDLLGVYFKYIVLPILLFLSPFVILGLINAALLKHMSHQAADLVMIVLVVSIVGGFGYWWYRRRYPYRASKRR